MSNSQSKFLIISCGMSVDDDRATSLMMNGVIDKIQLVHYMILIGRHLLLIKHLMQPIGPIT